ncbi:MAG: DUF3791 domain-containing protein [Bacteroidales bacterium]|nr:DUF3791 domain-containing protein [Bacteroidales bacterium]MCD8394349.1 DUF3791 domain-containing protein [Bacteroidales bacterium]
MDYCIHKFAERFKLSLPEAFSYLYENKGLSFLDECYEAEHLLSLDDAVTDLATICRHNGGVL